MVGRNERHRVNKLFIWNARSIKNKKDELLRTCNQLNVDIIIITESWLKSVEQFQIPGFTSIRNDRSDGKGGICILVKKQIDHQIAEIYNNTSTNTQFLHVRLGKLDIITVYNPPQNRLSEEVLRRLISKIQPINTIITGDFNINALTDNESQGQRYIEIQLIFSQKELICLNDKTPTRLGSLGQNHSAPDLTFCSNNLVNNVHWEVFPDTLNSDHFPIILTTDSIIQNNDSITSRYNIKNFNGERFSQYLKEKVIEIKESTNGLVIYEEIIDIITVYLNKYHPERCSRIKNNKRKPVWWTAECSKVIAKRRLAIGKFKKQMSQENYINLKKATALSKRILKQEKREGWKRYCESLSNNNSNNAASVWKRIKWFTNHKPTTIHHIMADKNWQDTFLRLLTPDWTEPKLNENSDEQCNTPEIIEDITLEELINAIPKKRNTKPGSDNISYNMIGYIPEDILRKLLYTFNWFFKTNVIPDKWREFKIVPILKPNKPVNEPQSYRPIALSNCFRKIFEKIIANRLYFYLERSNRWPKSQYGFRKGYSTLNNLALLYTDILIAFHKKAVIDAVFLDIKQAYDNIRPDILVNCLTAYQIPKQIILIIYALITRRIIIN